MSLEQEQSAENFLRAATGRITASNDPQQAQHDSNELLIKGAEMAAAGRTFGYSEEETLAATSMAMRRQNQKEAFRNRGRRQAEWEQKRKTLGDWEGESRKIEGKELSTDEYDITWGQDQSDFQNFRADDRGFTQDEETGEIRAERFDEQRPIEVADFPGMRYVKGTPGYIQQMSQPIGFIDNTATPVSALRDALSRIEEGTEKFGYSAFPGAAAVAGRLEDDMRQNLEADRSLARELVKRDSARFDPEVKEANDWKADAAASKIGGEQFLHSGAGTLADEAIGRIAEIRSISNAGETAHVIRSADDAIKGQIAQREDGLYVDPETGLSVAVQGPEAPSGDHMPNDASSSNALNAPQTALDWVDSSLPMPTEARSEWPQSDITLETTTFANRVRDWGRRHGHAGLTQISDNVRNLSEIDAVAKIMEGHKRKGNKTFTVPDPKRPGKQIPAGNQVISGLMHELGMNPNAQSELANSMFQMEAARRSVVNENPTGTYLSRMTKQGPAAPFTADVEFGDRPGPTQIRIMGSGTKSKKTGSNLKTSFANLPDRSNQTVDARKPLIGMPSAQVSSTSSFQQSPIYNRTGEVDPKEIRRKLTDAATDYAARSHDTWLPGEQAYERNEDNIRNASFVAERDRRASKAEADRMSAIIASLPPVGRRTRLDRRG